MRPRRAHPRSRGENFAGISISVVTSGSSPLTRGKYAVDESGSAGAGLIPAHAGKIQPPTVRGRCRGAHPRSRGENTAATSGATTSVGSSPLTRGKRRADRSSGGQGGLIPAHAGKTADLGFAAGETKAHPRSRGENGGDDGVLIGVDGSSPLTRGKPLPATLRARYGGLIPAHAGKTHTVRAPRGISWAHPRSRGENRGATNSIAGHPGSSPLTRGKPVPSMVRVPAERLIPAHAGNTQGFPDRGHTTPAHPRSRGENSGVSGSGSHHPGSSPLTRGKHFLTCAFIAQIGQILESLELCASSETYSLKDVSATDSLRDRVRSIGLDPLNSTGASSA